MKSLDGRSNGADDWLTLTVSDIVDGSSSKLPLRVH